MVEFEKFVRISKYARTVDKKKLQFIYDGILEYVNRSGKRPEQLHILEVGCGDGSISLPLSTLGASITAFDIDPTLVDGLNKEIALANIRNISVFCQTAYAFQSDMLFDIVVASEVLEHVDFPEKLVRIFKEHLKEDGCLIVTVPNGYGPWELSNKLKASFRRNRSAECGHHHVNFFTLKRFKALLASHEFDLVAFGKSDALSGLSYSVATNKTLSQLDLTIADVMPSWFSSGWYFVFKSAKRR